MVDYGWGGWPAAAHIDLAGFVHGLLAWLRIIFVEGECGKTLVQHYIVLLITAKLVCS